MDLNDLNGEIRQEERKTDQVSSWKKAGLQTQLIWVWI